MSDCINASAACLVTFQIKGMPLVGSDIPGGSYNLFGLIVIEYVDPAAYGERNL